MKHFLLIYDAGRGELREPPREFDRPAPAIAAYETVEREHLGDESVRIVLLGGRSLDEIKVTHANYFGRRDSKSLRPFFSPRVRPA
jgi:hypothetical protein